MQFPPPQQPQPPQGGLVPHFPYGYVQPPAPPPPYAYMGAPPMPPPPQVHAFFNPWEPPPVPVAAPADAELQKRIEKLAEYAAKNGPDFETLTKGKQKDNPAYAFLFGGEGHGYYRYKLYTLLNPYVQPFNPTMVTTPPPVGLPPGLPVPPPGLPHPAPGLPGAPLGQGLPGTAPGLPPSAGPGLQGAPFLQYPPLPFFDQGNAGVPLGGSVTPEVLAELRDRLEGLTGSKDSIQMNRMWYMQMPLFAPSLAETVHEKIVAWDHLDRQLHALYLINDILFTSLALRANVKEPDVQAAAFRPFLGPIFQATYRNCGLDSEKEQVEKMLQYWGSKEVFDRETIKSIERSMRTRPEVASASISPERKQEPTPATVVTPSTIQSSGVYVGTSRSTTVEPSYPLFPPGLIPGMVRKMQIGSGVPYSALSPVDIPTVIPAATTSESYILERVNKFFREIGESDPLSEVRSESEDEAEQRGPRIPPPPQLGYDPETGTLADGSVEHRPGVSSSGRLGLGAAADPNEGSQYDDVYTSYRKQRSTNYHTSLSARAAAAASR